MIFNKLALKVLLLLIVLTISACDSPPSEVSIKIQQDIVDLNKSTLSISSSDLRFRSYRLMAKKGNSEAMVELANSYLYEENIRPFNEKKAMKWLSKSALIGNPHASSELAEIYSEGLYDGEGNVRIKSDKETSLMWSYIASEQSKNLSDKEIILVSLDTNKTDKFQQMAKRAKQRAEQWLSANNT